MQKTNIIRDYLEDINEIPESRMFWPRKIWGKYADKLEVHIYHFSTSHLRSDVTHVEHFLTTFFLFWWTIPNAGLKIRGEFDESSELLEWNGHQCLDAYWRLLEVHGCVAWSFYISVLCHSPGQRNKYHIFGLHI